MLMRYVKSQVLIIFDYTSRLGSPAAGHQRRQKLCELSCALVRSRSTAAHVTYSCNTGLSHLPDSSLRKNLRSDFLDRIQYHCSLKEIFSRWVKQRRYLRYQQLEARFQRRLQQPERGRDVAILLDFEEFGGRQDQSRHLHQKRELFRLLLLRYRRVSSFVLNIILKICKRLKLLFKQILLGKNKGLCKVSKFPKKSILKPNSSLQTLSASVGVKIIFSY